MLLPAMSPEHIGTKKKDENNRRWHRHREDTRPSCLSKTSDGKSVSSISGITEANWISWALGECGASKLDNNIWGALLSLACPPVLAGGGRHYVQKIEFHATPMCRPALPSIEISWWLAASLLSPKTAGPRCCWAGWGNQPASDTDFTDTPGSRARAWSLGYRSRRRPILAESSSQNLKLAPSPILERNKDCMDEKRGLNPDMNAESPLRGVDQLVQSMVHPRPWLLVCLLWILPPLSLPFYRWGCPLTPMLELSPFPCPIYW